LASARQAPITKELQLPVDGKVPGKLTVKLECKYKSIGVKKKGTPSEAASDTDFEMMEKPRTNKPMAALVEEELLEEEEEPVRTLLRVVQLEPIGETRVGMSSRGRFATPDSSTTIVARIEGYTYPATTWALRLVQGACSVAA
jgi:hypothetical protein